MYEIGDYIPHEDYFNDDLKNFEHDIALIKIGARLDEKMRKTSDVDGLEFEYYIRPVCLPCTGTCLTEEELVDEHRSSLITPDMDDIQKCSIEEKLLLSNDAKAVVTGFGHMNISHEFRYDFKASPNLRQALLQIENYTTCQQEIKKIEEKLEDDNFKYSNKMFCCKSGIHNKTVDACKGDSGGPLVREVKNDQTRKSCWIQVGIVSFGYGCGTNIAGFYTNVAKYIPWILPKIHIPSNGEDDS